MIAPGIGLPFKLHWLPVAADEVSTTDPPKLQKVVGPPAVIVGVDGVGLMVIVAEPVRSAAIGVQDDASDNEPIV